MKKYIIPEIEIIEVTGEAELLAGSVTTNLDGLGAYGGDAVGTADAPMGFYLWDSEN